MNTVSTSMNQGNLERMVNGRAGALAMLTAIAAQLVWRAADPAAVRSLPEQVAQALARFVPMGGGQGGGALASPGKITVFVLMVVVLVAAGARLGGLTGRLRERRPRIAGRVLATGVAALVIVLVAGGIVWPLEGSGFFGFGSARAGDLWSGLLLVVAVYGVVWNAAIAMMTTTKEMDAMGRGMNRRQAIGWGAAMAASGATAVAASAGVRAAGQPGPSSVEADAAAQAIATGRRANGAAVTAQEDPFALFVQLEAEERLTPLITATDDFYVISKNYSDPIVPEEGWSVRIFGMVNQELTFTLEQLRARTLVKKITTLSCISNDLNGDLVGTAEWEGVPLAELLAEAGLKEGVVDLKLTAADDYEESFPVAFGLDPDTLLVVGMNGEPLTDGHGFPARLIVPGIYGMKNVKWLSGIEAIDTDFKGFWQERGWSDPAVPQIWGRIDSPTGTIDPGPTHVAGVASAGDRDVTRVEVSLDGGDTWADAQIEPSIEPPFTWVRWALALDAQPGGEYDVVIRATDGIGDVMTELVRSPMPDGATGYPRRRVKVRD